MEKVITLVALTALTVGCAAETEELRFSTNFLVDARYSEYEVEIIAHAVDEMKRAFNSPDFDAVALTFGAHINDGEFTTEKWDNWDGEHAQFFKISRSESGYAELASEVGQNFVGLANPSSAIACVAEGYTLSDGTVYFAQLELCTMHELGHHFGLGHIDGTLMQDGYGVGNTVTGYPCVNDELIEAFCSLHECNSPVPSCE